MRDWRKGCGIGCAVLGLLGLGTAIYAVVLVRSLFFRPKPPDPVVAPNTALRPMFVMRSAKPYGAGTAVAVRLGPGRPAVLLTALHLFGPDAGQKVAIPPSQLNVRVASVILSPFGAFQTVGDAVGSLINRGPLPDESLQDVSHDVAAFTLDPSSKVAVLPLARRDPRLGDWLWLVGDVYNHRPQQQRLFPGRVIYASPRGVRVHFEERFPKRAFSGAPLIDEHGSVAGILIGGSDRDAVINPAGSIRRRIEGG